MLKRVFALCAFGLALPAALLHAQDLFVLPGSGGTNGLAQAFVTNPLTNFGTFTAAVGSFALLPNLAASEYFVVGSLTLNSIYAIQATSLAPTQVASLPSPASQALITPNGKVLVVVAGNVHLFNTATNTELVPGGISQGSGYNTAAVAASLDSTSIFAVGTNASGASLLTAISASSYSATATLSLTQRASAVSVGPNGLVYVSLPNQILEVDPRTLQSTFNGAISVNGTPGPLVFTPDGKYGVGINQTLFGNSLLIATLANHTATDPSLGLPELTSLQVVGVDTLLALSSQGLYQITISSPTSVSVNPIRIDGAASTDLAAMTVTNDVPAGAHSTVQAAYLVTGNLPSNNVYQYSPQSESVVAQYQVSANVTPGAIAYAVPTQTTSTTHPASLLVFGTNQAILPSATTEPLVVQVLDVNNLPVSGYDVEFETTASGATLSATSAVTGSNGYALTYLTASATPGPIAVTATVGTLIATFPIDVSTTAQGGGGPTLTIVAGQGQLMAIDTSTASGLAYGSPLQVLASDVNGNPIIGLPVTFSVPPTGGTLEVSGLAGADSQVVNTNTAGVASVDFLTTSLPSDDSLGYLQTLVTASAANTNAVTFYITAVPPSPTPSINLLAPTPGSTLTGAEGSVLPGAVKAEIFSYAGFGIPNVALGVTDSSTATSLLPTVSCNAPGGFVLTDSSGLASCDLLFGPQLGSSTFIATIGDTHNSTPIRFTVTPGPPGKLQITQGNNQTGTPGQTLPLALVVHVTDSGGNTIQGATVSWQVVTAGTVTLSNISGVTDSNGNASALATLGPIGGVAQVTATSGTASATFNLTVNIPSTGIQKVSGDQQTTVVNTAFASPLVVEVVNSSGNGLPGVQVNFQITAGTATLGSSSAITNSSGQASTTVTAGATPGTITVSATSSTFSATFTLTAQPPGPSGLTIVNGASFDPYTGISPGGIATIRGTGILNGVTGVLAAPVTAGQLPTTFSGVTITFNGTPAPIYYVEETNGSDQISVQVPLEVQPGPAVALVVSVASGTATISVPVKPFAPGIFTSIYSGKTYAVAVRPDGSQVSPTNPAQRGENIQLYVTGLGQATPAIATGAVGVADQVMVAPLVVGLNNGGVPLISAVYGPGLIGIYVVTLQVPADTQTGPYQPIGLIAYDSTNNAYFAQSTYIPIE
jgi:uncharacterized protein (TIGR03437 family)